MDDKFNYIIEDSDISNCSAIIDAQMPGIMDRLRSEHDFVSQLRS